MANEPKHLPSDCIRCVVCGVESDYERVLADAPRAQVIGNIATMRSPDRQNALVSRRQKSRVDGRLSTDARRAAYANNSILGEVRQTPSSHAKVCGGTTIAML